MQTLPANKNEIILNVIVPSLGGFEDDFDLDAIFNDCFEFVGGPRVFEMVATAEEFWASVARHEIK